MAKTYQQFKKEYLGKAVDVDGYYGAQCWDGSMAYSAWLGYPVFHCGVTGFAQDIWTQRKTNGILKYYDEVTNLQPGDIVVFKKSSLTPYSHIAIFDSDAGNGYGNFLGENQTGQSDGKGGKAFNIVRLPYSITYETAFRPKCFVNTPAASTPAVETKKVGDYTVTLEKGTATFTTGPVNVRDGGPNGKIVGQYNKGDSVNYWGKYIGNGHRYVVYTSYSGKTRFVAVSGSEKYGVAPWATFK